MRYRFDDVELDTDAYQLRVGGERVPLEPQVFEVLRYLIEHRDRLVPRTELLDAIWGDRFVSDSALSSRLKTARAVIGDDGRTQRLIRTVHGRGLQFVGVTSEVAPDEDLANSDRSADGGDRADEPHQTVRFVTADDGAHLAVATIGTAGTTMIKSANWLTHVEFDQHSPVWRHWWSALGERFRFVRYDARGCGLSDRDIDATDLTDLGRWTSDLESVVDASGADRFVLLGGSQGAAPAIDYAVRHPSRVSHLILYGSYSRGMRRRDAANAAEARTLVDLIRTGWGGTRPAFRTFFTMNYIPEATSEQIRWFNDLQRASASAENAVRLETAFYDIDLTELATQVEVPTLVVHGRGDATAPYEEGRRLAALIPDAEFVSLDSDNHILLSDEPAWAQFLVHVDRFCATGR